MAAVFPFSASAGEVAQVRAKLGADGQAFTLECDGFSGWKGGYSAKVEIGGEE